MLSADFITLAASCLCLPMPGTFHPAFFIEIHGKQLHVDCHAFLEERGYNVEDEYGRLEAVFVEHK